MADNPEPTVSSRRIFDGKILSLRVDTVALSSGIEATREVIEHGPAVAIVPVDDTGNVHLVKQYRKAIGDSLLEVPAGRMERGEDPAEAARRELGEETGLKAGKLDFLGSYFTTPGFTDEEMYTFLATDLREGEAHPDEDEEVERVIMPLEQAVGMVKNGDLHDGKSIAALLIAWQRLGMG